MAVHVITNTNELPVPEGPQLQGSSNGRYRKLQFLEFLGQPVNSEDVPEAMHAYYFKVNIDAQLFALNIVISVAIEVYREAQISISNCSSSGMVLLENSRH